VLKVDEDGDGDFLDHYGGKPFPDWTGSFGGSINVGRSWKVYSLFEYKAGDTKYSCLTCAFRNANARGQNTVASTKVEAVLVNPASTAQQRLSAAKDWLNLVALNSYPGLNQSSPGDFIRWRELSVTYTAPRTLAERLGARDMSLSLTGRNLTLWAPKYIGQDPEINIFSRASVLACRTISMKASMALACRSRVVSRSRSALATNVERSDMTYTPCFAWCALRCAPRRRRSQCWRLPRVPACSKSTTRTT
jgi:hypothetical protein